MISLENSGMPRDHQLPDLTPAALHLLSDRIAGAAGAGLATSAVTATHSRAPWLRRSVLTVAAAAGVVVVTSALLPSPTAEAWSATPTLADAGTWTMLEAECQDMMGTSAPAVLVERRGTSTFAVLDDSSLCLNVTDLPGLEGAGALRTGGRDVLPVHAPGPRQVQVVHAASLGGVGKAQPGAELPDGVMTAGYMAVTGRAGTAVEKVVIHTVDHGDVAASLEGGWFAAWWPSLDEPTSLTVTTSTGTGTYDLDL